MPTRRVLALSLILSLFCAPIFAQNGEGDLLARIRKEAMERSQIIKKDAMVVAWAVYQLATRDELLPRFSKEKMPAKPADTSTTQPSTNPERTAPGKSTKPRKEQSKDHKEDRQSKED